MLVVMMMLALSTQIKSAELFELASFKYLLMLLIWEFALLSIMLELF